VTAPKRILVAKPGLDGHDRGAKVVARALRDAGFEVIYTGLRQTPAQIAQAAVQEDVDAVGLSSLSGAHRELFPAVVRALREAGAGNVVIFAGGVIPQEDVAVLLEAGIERLFPPGTDTREIVRFLRERLNVEEDQGASASSRATANPSPSRT
jgi:methylmalonyl-CoA mutase, C-terminal domain